MQAKRNRKHNRAVPIGVIGFLATSVIVEGFGLLSVSRIVDILDLSVDSFLYLVVPITILQFGFILSFKVGKCRKHLSALSTYFLFPLMLSCIFLMVVYLTTGSVRGSFSRVPVEITSRSPIAAIRIILWRFFWDIGYSGLAALIVVLVTPVFATFVRFSYKRAYLEILRILKGRETREPLIEEKRAKYRFFLDFKAFLLLNALFSAGIILFLPKIATPIYTQVISNGREFLVDNSMLFMTIPAVLSSILIAVRERSFRIYWGCLKFLVASLSISNVLTFVLSPWTIQELKDLLTIVPGLYFYNLLGLSFCATIFRRGLLPRLSRGTRLLLMSLLVAGFALFIVSGLFFIFPSLPLGIAALVSGLLDATAVGTTVYALSSALREITHKEFHPKTLLLETFLAIMVAYSVYAHYLSGASPIFQGDSNPFWLVFIPINVLGGLLFFAHPRLGFLIVVISLVLSTIVYWFFGLVQIMSTLGAILISYGLKVRALEKTKKSC